ncbi:MAG: NADH-quinone oxidoreductase subunit F, partial [Azoarcus sp. PHD]
MMPMLVNAGSRRGPNRPPLPESARAAAQAALAGETPLRDQLIEYLHRLQDAHGALFADHVAALAEAMKLARAEVYEVATFYHHFDVVAAGDSAPAGLTVRVCDSLTCAMHGGEELAGALEGRVGAGVRIQRVPCVGRCDCAPVAVVGQNPVHQASADKVMAVAEADDRVEPAPDIINFDAYRAAGGYHLYETVRSGEHDVEEILGVLDTAILRGLGGAGFPAARKWRTVMAQPAPRNMA